MNDISSDLITRGNEAAVEYLAHHGVLGMKWGIRKDGKPQGWQGGAGKAAKKVGSGAKKVAKGTASAAVKSRAKVQQVQARRNEKKALEEARLNELKLEDRKRQMSSSYSIASTTRSARALSKHMDALSDAELKQRINRLKLENEVRDLSAKERERSRSWVSKTLEESAKNSVKSVATYGMTKSGRKLIDGFLDEVSKSSDNQSGSNNSSSSSSSSSSSNSSSNSSAETNRTRKRVENKRYNSTKYNKSYGARASNRSGASYKYNKTYGASRSSTKGTPLLTSSSSKLGDAIDYELPDDYK